MIRLHHCHQTRSMRVLWLLHEIGCDFEVVEHGFDKSLRSDAYTQLHPVGRVPTLEIDGDIVWESGAAVEVLCEHFPASGLGRSVEHGERAQWLTLLHFAETVSQHTAALTQQHVALFEDWMRSPVIMTLEAKRLARCFAAIEKQLSDGRDALLPSGVSAVDIAVGQAVYMGQHFVRLEDFPGVFGWFSRMEAREAFQRSLPPDGAPRLYTRRFYDPWPVEKP